MACSKCGAASAGIQYSYIKKEYDRSLPEVSEVVAFYNNNYPLNDYEIAIVNSIFKDPRAGWRFNKQLEKMYIKYGFK